MAVCFRKNNTAFHGRGFSTFELLIAFGIMAIVMTGVIAVVFQIQSSAGEIKVRAYALLRARELLEKISTDSISNSSFLSIISTATSTLPNDPDYLFSMNVIDHNQFSKDVTVRVSWGMGYKYVELTGRIIDRNGALGASNCLISKWKTTLVGGSITIASGTPTSIDVRNDYAYIGVDPIKPADPDLFIVDVRNPSNPTILTSLNTGPGILGLKIAGKYLYIANSSINSQLQIVDISDPSNPLIISSYKLPGTYNDGTTIGNSIYYYNQQVYLGTQKSQIAEFHDIDVSNPILPKEVVAVEIGAAVNAITIIPPYVLAATPLSTEITVFDYIQGLKSVGLFDAPGGSGNGKSFAYGDGYLFLGRTVGGNELYVLSAENIPTLLPLSSVNLNTSVNSMIFSEKLLFFGTTDPLKEFQVWSVIDPRHPVSIGSIDFPERVSAMDCDGTTIYAILENSDALRILYSS